MTSQSSICSLCFNNIEEKYRQIINRSIQDMLRTLLINTDLLASENAVICRTCLTKLENHFCFKKKCIFTEDTINPFIVENVKMNLNEIHSQIIKSEVEAEKNVCRLCLQHSDDDMTLNEEEKQQFQRLFPEINLNLTNFVILCLSCYNTLHKYFTFVTLFHSNNKFSMNGEESSEKNILLLTGEIGMKSERDSSDFLEDKFDIGLEQIVDIKSEDTKSSLMDVEENDDIKPLLLQEELNIKSDGDSSEEEYLYTNPNSIEASIKPQLQLDRVQIEKRRLDESNIDKSSSSNLPKKNCTKRQRDSILITYTNSRKIQVLKCDECDYESKHTKDLKHHILCHQHSSSKTTMYTCDKCNYESKWRENFKRHFIRKHTDPSEIHMNECNKCSYKTKEKSKLKRHMLTHTPNHSEVTVYKCDKCDYESKRRENFQIHFVNKHTDPSRIHMYKCKECCFKTKYKANLKLHILTHETNPSKVTKYKCDKCDFETRWYNSIKYHVRKKHIGPPKIQICKSNYETKYKAILKRHTLTPTTSLSEVKVYKCKKCDYESNRLESLKKHFISKHIDPSEILMNKCKECRYETKHKAYLKRHMLVHATNLSEFTMYKCDKCDYESKWHANLKKHVIRKHSDHSQIQVKELLKLNTNQF